MKPTQNELDAFSPNLFWDLALVTLNMNKNKRFIIQRVLEYGTLSDWKISKERYGVEKIAEEMKKVRTLDEKTLSFVCTL